jgi:ABC-type polysaccharide/polyol phosphate export permease
MLHVIQAYRAILLNGQWPEFAPLFAVMAASVLLLGGGGLAFRQASWHFAEEV